MKLCIKDLNGVSQGELDITFPIIENNKGAHAVHQTVVAYLAAQRSGTACTKTMGEVAGSGKKPWRQKGTGRARAGSFASPLWRGGGVVFGPKPRDFSKTVTKSTRQLALRKALSERITAGDVTVVEEIKLTSPKTKELVKTLKAMQLEKSVLILVAASDENLNLSARNVADIEVATGAGVNAYQILRSQKILCTREAFKQIEQRLSH